VAYDQDLVERVLDQMHGTPGLSHRRMFGGYCFLINGHIATGVRDDRLLVRFPPEETDTVMARDGVSEFGGAKRGWAWVSFDVINDDRELRDWIQPGVRIAGALPPKF
jgi:TfoX/Sxy family transcriptional regulator of competence genes